MSSDARTPATTDGPAPAGRGDLAHPRDVEARRTRAVPGGTATDRPPGTFAPDSRPVGPSHPRSRPAGPSPARPRPPGRRARGPHRAVRVALLAVLALALPLPALAHSLSGRVDTPLPFTAYVIGAAVAVALSFAFVALGDAGPLGAPVEGHVRVVPAWLRLGLRAIGLVAWTWIVLQAGVGGSSDADVASLFLWVYGWVALPILSAVLGPVWAWLDPFSSLYDLGAGLLRRAGIGSSSPRPYPELLGAWPAAIGLAVVVWMELSARILDGRPLGLVLVAYTVVTLAGMAQYGRDAWRSRAEVFGVWFGVLARLAPVGLVGPPEAGRVTRRPLGTGLLRATWTPALVALVAVGTGSIIYDGLSQTKAFFDVFGVLSLAGSSLVLALFLAVLVALFLAVARVVGLAAVGAGLVPVALGYLVAHYMTLLLFDGQRIVVAISDPLQLGWDLVGTAFWEPNQDVLSTTTFWTLQVAAVIVGHVVGAWAGHGAIRRERAAGRAVPQWPLALLMVGLTSLTLWSLGQNLAFGVEATALATLPGDGP